MQVVTSPPVMCALSPYADLGEVKGKACRTTRMYRRCPIEVMASSSPTALCCARLSKYHLYHASHRYAATIRAQRATGLPAK
jgi:hypothetical protein